MKTSLSIFILLTLFSVLSPAQNTKYNVCSITINSSDEIENFKKNLPKDQFTFIDLSPTGDIYANSEKGKNLKDHFLKPYCLNKTTCDILIISGHFGGTFSGTAGYSLSLDDMNTLSCSNLCDGIFKAPKEVFLFGCNTMAGKEKDTRSPREYIRVLIEHGYPENEARQISNLRYGPTGGSFADSMQRVFNHSAKIYGFSSISPRGSTSATYLDSYFQTIPSYSEHLKNLNFNQKNIELAKAFRLTALAQGSGRQSNERDLMCKILDPQESTRQRISSIQMALDGKTPLTFIPAIEKSIALDRNLRNHFKGKKTSTEIAQVFDKIKNNLNLKRLLSKSLKTLELMLPTNAFDLMEFSEKMGWFTKQELSQFKANYFKNLIADPSQESTLKMCELRSYEVAVDNEMLRTLWNQNLNSEQEAARINCLPPSRDEDLFKLMTEHTFKVIESRPLSVLNHAYLEWLVSSLNLSPDLGERFSQIYLQQNDEVFFNPTLIQTGLESNAFQFAREEISESAKNRIIKNKKFNSFKNAFIELMD